MKILLKEFKANTKPTVRRTSATNDPFRTLIACLLSLRTQDKNTAKASASLFAVADTPQKIIKLPKKRLEKLIFSSGYYKNKAKSIQHVCKVLLKEYKGRVPDTREELLAIKGIGPKTANIVLCFAYGKCVIPVDTHVHRIPNRLGLVKTKTPEKTEVELMKVFHRKHWREINTTFILFGKNICLPISPMCTICPLNKLCPRVGVKKYR
ncbi:MAG: endonuclease III [bacterium]|nr:endonuclease III [bacterium]